MRIVAGSLLAGRYRAEVLLGRGGMGEVWRCRDEEGGSDVAIKAVRAEFLRDPGAVRLFHAEVIAVARLCHPGIVAVLDLLRDDSGAALLVMENVKGVALSTLQKPGWPVVRDVLRRLLDALAYAHAHGVLHLDIKPENVLVERPLGGELRTTLLDFGVARIKRPGRSVERWFDRDAVIGTVEYMAPEQCSGTFERFGPWSDLFSVGALAFEMCAGKRPFPGAADRPGLIRRLQVPPPRLVPAIPDVPAGLPDLVDKMLALEPRDRPLYAADVLAALDALEPSPIAPAEDAEDIARSSVETSEVSISEIPTHRIPRHEAQTVEQPPTAPRRVSPSIPPMSESPNSPLAARAEQLFSEEPEPPAGAHGLFGLRDLPLLGRQEERLVVWSAVRTAIVERRPTFVLIDGPAGVGKSRLAREALERAVQAGLCYPMLTSWSEGGASDEGLRGLLENLLDTRGARPPEVRARLDFWLDRVPDKRTRAFVREVELLLRPPRDAAPDAELPVRTAIEAISLASTLRPVIVWLDDVHWSRGEAQRLVTALTTSASHVPVCVLVTARLAEEDARASFEAIASSCDHVRVSLGMLGSAETQRLVRALLEVDDRLATLVANRSEGNPLFATQLVRQLVLADAIKRRGGRYHLSRAVDLSTIPADIGALFQRRVEQSGVKRRELAALAIVRGRTSLEIAAALSAELGPSLDAAIATALRVGLLRVEAGAYVWEHNLLREYLIKSVPRNEAPALHAAAAKALAPLVDREDVQEERAQHLRRASKPREACEALLSAGLWSARHADAAPRRSRFELLASWASAAGYADLTARAYAELGYAHAERGDMRAAEDAIAAACAMALDGQVAAWIALRRSQVVRLAGRTADGAAATQEALELARRSREGEVERMALVQIGIDRGRALDREGARAVLEEVRALCRAADDRVREAHAILALTMIAPPEESLGLCERSIALAASAGALRVELSCKQVWVDLLFRTGKRDQARHEARELAQDAARRGLRQTVSLLELQGAAWAALDGDVAAASSHRDAAAQWGAANGAVVERVVLSGLDVFLAVVAGDHAAAAARLTAFEQGRGGFRDAVLRELLLRAADHAEAGLGARIRSIADA